ncbi:MAG TPA: ACT domain-containing protein [Solirubrobacterales bacterium]|jgi:hypothetical protein
MKDLTVVLDDEPGSLADLGEATGGASINIEGMCATTSGGKGEIHILVEDPEATRQALQGAVIEVSGDRDVLVVEVEDRPGTMAEVARKLGDADVNIEFAYTTFGGVRLVFGVDDLDKARAAV